MGTQWHSLYGIARGFRRVCASPGQSLPQTDAGAYLDAARTAQSGAATLPSATTFNAPTRTLSALALLLKGDAGLRTASIM